MTLLRDLFLLLRLHTIFLCKYFLFLSVSEDVCSIMLKQWRGNCYSIYSSMYALVNTSANQWLVVFCISVLFVIFSPFNLVSISRVAVGLGISMDIPIAMGMRFPLGMQIVIPTKILSEWVGDMNSTLTAIRSISVIHCHV